MTEQVPAAEPVIVPPSALNQQLKAQLRIGIAAIGGSLVLRHVLPAWAVNDQTVDYLAGLAMVGGAAAWSWFRARLNHARWLAVARDQRVPDEVAKVAPTTPTA
ncbi:MULTISPECIES: hypothetical protein [unclassified Sphingomonas]|uniref:hypothetical protein n=1 Tax=unclassified Sphingomonas TaxID=196159 RepID=UPI00226A0BC7|nr:MULTISPECIES: hypothetical protein [unclassified Sphingomonas]